MTTTITVKTHAWPVRVTTIDQYGSAHSGVETVTRTETMCVVPPNSSRDFHITDTRSIACEELPLNKALIDPVAEAARVAGVDDEEEATPTMPLPDLPDFPPEQDEPDDNGEEVDPALRA